MLDVAIFSISKDVNVFAHVHINLYHFIDSSCVQGS